MTREELEAVFMMINRDLFLFLMGLFLVSGIGIGAKVWQAILRLIRGTDQLVVMHEAPDEYGFGTKNIDATGEHLIRIAKSSAKLAHWQAEQLCNAKPPPLDLD